MYRKLIILYICSNINTEVFFFSAVPKMSMAEPKFGTRIKPLRKSRFRREVAFGDTSKSLPVEEPFPVEVSDVFLQLYVSICWI